MSKLLFISLILVTAAAVSADEPLYVLEAPGIAFGWLTAELNPPVEGNLTAESGSVASTATTVGVEYHIHYWAEDMTPNDRTGDWLEQRLQSVLPPDMLESFNPGDLTWSEASMKSPFRNESSLGLVVSQNFNFITDTGAVVARGKAYAVFVNGYSVLIYGYAPEGILPPVGSVIDEIVAWAYLAG